jgi:hypothetical protein
MLVVPLESVTASAPYRTLLATLLDCLADLSPAVEPDGPDAAYVDLTGAPASLVKGAAGRLCRALDAAAKDLQPVVGLGATRLAARALAECCLPAGRLYDADVRWLCPEDPVTLGRLLRLGLSTFGGVAALGEGALVYQFGKKGRLIYRRAAWGQDFTPVRSLYPPPRAEATIDLSEYPVDDLERLHARLGRLADSAGAQLRSLSRVGRRVVLRAETEDDALLRSETVLPVPAHSAPEVLRAALRLLGGLRLDAPVTRLWLAVEDLEAPVVQTPDLFGGKTGDRHQAITAVRHFLTTRYGPKALTCLSERPVAARDRRFALLSREGITAR